MSVEEIQRATRKGKDRYSKQAIYKELGLLLDSGIVLKTKKGYRITLTWVFDNAAHAESLLEQAKKGHFGSDLLPESGKHRSWKYSDNVRTDRLWVQLVTSLLQLDEDPILFQALHHPWHSLLYKELNPQFENTLRRSGAEYYCVVGGDTYLDKAFIKQTSKGSFFSANAPGMFKAEETMNFTVIGQYVITTHYPIKFTKAVDQYFKSINSKRDVKAEDVLSLFQNPGNITTKIEHNQKKSLRIRRRFQRYFGLPLTRKGD
jgi:hypothetical protein